MASEGDAYLYRGLMIELNNGSDKADKHHCEIECESNEGRGIQSEPAGLQNITLDDCDPNEDQDARIEGDGLGCLHFRIL